MNVNRRQFTIGAMTGSLLTSPRAVSAQSDISMNLDVSSEAEVDLSGVELYFSNIEDNNGPTIELPPDGQAELNLPRPGTYRVNLFDRIEPSADIPLIYEFNNIEVDQSTEKLAFTIPKAYETQIKLVDSDGNAVEGLEVNLRSMNGTTGFRNDFVTTDKGNIKYIPENKTTLQLAGQIEVELQSGTTLDTLKIDKSTEFKIAVPEQSDGISLPNGDVTLIEPDESSEFNFPYILFNPDLNKEITVPLCIKPHNAPAVRTEKALKNQLTGDNSPAYGSLFSIATENKFPGIIPGFPRTPNDGPDLIQTLALPSYRSDLLPDNYQLKSIATDDFTAQSLNRIDEQLLAMINDARERLAPEQYSIAEQVHMSGFSAAATFCNRFALLHPSKVQTTTTGGSVVLPLPKDTHDDVKIRYPIGTADYTSITNRKFDFSSWKNTNRFVFVGKEDRPEPDSSSYWYGSLRYEESVSDVYGKRRVTERFPFIRSQYKKISPDKSEFKLFSGVGHSINTEMEQDVIEYHQDTATASSDGPNSPADPTERALQITGKDNPGELTQDDITSALTRFNRGESANGIKITQDDVTSLITLFERN